MINNADADIWQGIEGEGGNSDLFARRISLQISSKYYLLTVSSSKTKKHSEKMKIMVSFNIFRWAKINIHILSRAL